MEFKSLIKTSLRAVKRTVINRPRSIIFLIKNPKFWNGPSYSPEAKYHRKKWLIFIDQIINIIKYGSVNTFYFTYGFDVLSRKECKEFVDYSEFMYRRIVMNYKSENNNSCILRDKVLFNLFANGLGIKTPKNIFLINDEKVFCFDSKKNAPLDKELFNNRGKLFFKLLDGECGKGAFILEIGDDHTLINGDKVPFQKFRELLSGNTFIVQELLYQHKVLSSLHPQSINTIRMVTVRHPKTKEVAVMSTIIRIGTGDNTVDNAAQGGICVGIDLGKGALKKWGLYEPQFGTKTEIHPDTGIVFNNLKLPFLKEATEQALFLHSMLPNIHSIGWDISISENGPVFVEGNDNWEISLMQMVNGGEKNFFKEYFYE